MFEELYVRTQFDGRDYISVEEVCYLDQEGNSRKCEEATAACLDLTTCADQGRDTWSWLRTQIEQRLRSAGIQYGYLYFADERGEDPTWVR